MPFFDPRKSGFVNQRAWCVLEDFGWPVDLEIVKHRGDFIDGVGEFVKIGSFDPTGEGGDGEKVGLEQGAEGVEEFTVEAKVHRGAVVVELEAPGSGFGEVGKKAGFELWIVQSRTAGREADDRDVIGRGWNWLESAVGVGGEFGDLDVKGVGA